jgi:hypothetical protein
MCIHQTMNHLMDTCVEKHMCVPLAHVELTAIHRTSGKRIIHRKAQLKMDE